MTGDEDGIQPLQSGDAWTRQSADGKLHTIDPCGGAGDQVDAALTPTGGLGQGANVAQGFADGLGIESDHLRLGADLACDLRHLLVGDRADGAERLRHDQLGLEPLQGDPVELVDGLPVERRSRTAASISPALRPGEARPGSPAPVSAPEPGGRTRG